MFQSSKNKFIHNQTKGILMCEICDFYKKLSPAQKSAPALDGDGKRTIHGYYHENDAVVLARHYPRTGQATIEKIASLINYPRLLEVAGLVELVERYLEGSFSRLKGVAFEIASNPLSILFWSPRDKTVHRVKTRETELLHGAMEKMALRRGSLEKINDFLNGNHGLVLTYGCSCCAIAIAKSDLQALYDSDYYRVREGLGRLFDSDVLTTSGALFDGVSVTDVPQKILDASADFGQTEVRSYLRFAKATEAVIEENPITPDLTEDLVDVQGFLMGRELALIAT
jgi:hypothetical protein